MNNFPTVPPVNIPSGDWSSYIPTYEPQRFIYDTDECSQLGGCISPLEMYFNWLRATGQLSQPFIDFLVANGYFDVNGSFSFSERFMGILDGTSINGNLVQNAWKCFIKYGLIPRSKLNWTLEDAVQFPNQALMDTSYYNPAVITQSMIDLGKQFLSFLKGIAWGWTGGIGDGSQNTPLNILQTGLQTSPVAIVIPTPTPIIDWNEQLVPYTGGTSLDHAVCMYKIDPAITYPVFVADQYQPFLKQLQGGYYIPIAIAFFVLLN